MLLLPRTCRANFCAAKLTSFVAFEQLKMPTPRPPLRSRAARSPSAARSRASSHDAARSRPSSRTIGSTSLPLPTLNARTPLPGRSARSTDFNNLSWSETHGKRGGEASVDVRGQARNRDDLLVGAAAGSVHVFVLSGMTWLHQARLTPACEVAGQGRRRSRIRFSRADRPR